MGFFFFLRAVTNVSAATGINRTINFQGKIVNKADGTNIANTSYSFTFRLYDSASNGNQLPTGTPWSETQSLPVTDGIFRATLGSVTPFPATLDFNSDSLYLDITFNGETFGSRVRLTAVPYAFMAEKVNGLTVTNTTGTLTIPNGKTIQFGDAFTTSGAFPLTLTTTASTDITLPTTGILSTLAGNEIFTNKTVGNTGLVFSGAANDITTPEGEHFAIMPGAGGNVGIGSTSPNALLDVGGNATVSGNLMAGGQLQVGRFGAEPTGLGAGSMYYNTSTNKFRCFINAGWADCDTTGGGSPLWSTIQNPGGNLSLAMSTYTTGFNWATGTGSNNLFNLTTDASANGTGSLLNIQTGASSAVAPMRVRVGSTEALSVNSLGYVGIGTASAGFPMAIHDTTGNGGTLLKLDTESDGMTGGYLVLTAGSRTVRFGADQWIGPHFGSTTKAGFMFLDDNSIGPMIALDPVSEQVSLGSSNYRYATIYGTSLNIKNNVDIGGTRTIDIRGDYTGVGELSTGGIISTSTNDSLNIVPASTNGTAGSKLTLGYFNGDLWYSGLELANVAGGGATRSNLLLMKSGGNVGIGTTTADANLTVARQSGQTGNLQNWINEDGDVMTSVNKDGFIDLSGANSEDTTWNMVLKFNGATVGGSEVAGGFGNGVVKQSGSGRTLFNYIADNTTNSIFSGGVDGEGFRRFALSGGGNWQLGPGNSAPDTFMQRLSSGGMSFSASANAPIMTLSGSSGQNGHYLDVSAYGGSAGDVFAINSGGNVGIGSTSPNAKLDVAGTASVSGALTLANGSALRSAYGPLNLQYKSALNTWTTGLTIQDTTGYVGIGTTNPLYNLYIAGGGSDTLTVLDPGSGSANSFLYLVGRNGGNATSAYLKADWDGNLNVNVTTGKNINFMQNETTSTLYIKGDGSVGIGTTSPNAKLDVAGTASISGTLTLANGSALRSAYGPLTLNYKSDLDTWAAGLTLQDSTGYVGIGTTNPNSALQVTGNITSKGTGDLSEKFGYGATADGIYSLALGNIAKGNGPSAIALGYNSAAEVGSIAIGVSTTTGNNSVVIGTQSHVGHQSVAIGGDNDTANVSVALGLAADTTASNQFVVGSELYPINDFYFGKGVSSATPNTVTVHGTDGVDVTGGALYLTGGSGTAIGPVVLQSGGGNVGIGSTGPTQKLDVAGSATVSGNLMAGGQLQVGRFGAEPEALGNGAMYYNTATNKFRCFINNAWADCDTTGGSALWSAIQAPGGDLSLAMSTYKTTFNWATGTGSNNLFNLTTDNSSNGTGYLLNLATGTSSTVKPLQVMAGGNTAITVDASGNTNIGGAAGSEKLNINGSIQFTNTAIAAIDFPVNTSGMGNGSNLRISAGSGDVGTGGSLSLTGGSGTNALDVGGNVYVYGGTGSTDGDVILANTGSTARGNVGVGTFTPDARLEIDSSSAGVSGLQFTRLTSASTAGAAGTKVLSVDASGNVILVTDNTGAGSPSWSAIQPPGADLSLAMSTWKTGFNWATGTGTDNLFSLTTDNSSNGTGYLLNLATGTSSTIKPLHVAAGAVEGLLVDATGNVGIGTTNPAAKLDVLGEATVSGGLTFYGGAQTIATRSVNALNIGDSQTGAVIFGNNGSVIINKGGTQNFQVNFTSAPTVSMASISNAGQATTTSGANGLDVTYVTAGSSAITNAALNIAVTNTNNTAGAVIYGEQIATISGQLNTNETALLIGSGWDKGLDVSSPVAVNSTLTASNKTVIGNIANGFSFDPASGPSYTGTARPYKTVLLSPEYSGAVITTYYGAGTDSTNNTGSMTSDVDNTAGGKNFYSWTSTTASPLQSYTVAVRVTLPTDFSQWCTAGACANTNALEINFATSNNSSSNNALDAYIYNSSGSSVASSTSQYTNNTWTTLNFSKANLDTNWSTSGATATIYLRVRAMNSNVVKIGDIKLNYLGSY